MRIGLVSWAYPPEKSGLSRAACEIAQALAEAGHDVRVVTMDRSDRSMDGAVEVIGASEGGWLAWARRLPGIGHLCGPAMIARTVRRLHAERPFDVVEATNWYAPGLWVALTGPAPLVTRNSTPVATSAARSRSVRDRIDRWAAVTLEALSARASAGLISNTGAHGAKIAALYGTRPPGACHAVIGLSLPPAIVDAGRAASYPPGNDVLRLLFVGRNEPRKGTDALIGALPALAAEADAGTLPDFRLTMIGLHRQELDRLPPAALRRIDSYHRVEDDALHAALAAADIVVAPSRYESFGLVYQEAMTFGRPIAACGEDPSARLFVGGSGAGLLADDCTPQALGAILRRMLGDGDLRQALSAAARVAAGRFTRAGLAAETAAAYVAAVNGRSSAASSPGRPAPADMAS
ncbi:glycosyltransferase family 4 protein [Sphingomonas sp. 2R-10]|uniref:glycosyltransferase family 4 protein n=1 Tax=Sphingomonas sp. 2R-10 TaxID=3045148 RepID=UPI000F7A3814|nr:glycosyltransferase family 4 protein [Sphingomonas sp. 2R-10]MDJ0277835.1 glycosyltransferase family 4 protein [Sphingomonas sp. 2R-10]